jgi:urease accessory protein
MLIRNILGQITDEEFAEKTADYVFFEWYEAFMKIFKKVSSKGSEIAIRFDSLMPAQGLHEGDVLGVDGTAAFVVDFFPCEALIISADDGMLIPRICYEIGNKHAPLFYGSNLHEFITPYEESIKMLMGKIGAEVEIRKIKLNQFSSVSSAMNSHHHGEV